MPKRHGGYAAFLNMRYYYGQIDLHLADEPVQGVEVVFLNQQTAFHVDVSMRSALVVNEARWPELESE